MVGGVGGVDGKRGLKGYKGIQVNKILTARMCQERLVFYFLGLNVFTVRIDL